MVFNVLAAALLLLGPYLSAYLPFDRAGQELASLTFGILSSGILIWRFPAVKWVPSMALFLLTVLLSGGDAALAFADALFGSLVATLVALRWKKQLPSTVMRLLMVSRHDPTLNGGTETYIRNFFRSVGASSREIDVSYVTFDEGREQSRFPRVSFSSRRGGPIFRYLRLNESDVALGGLLDILVMAWVAAELVLIALGSTDAAEADAVYATGGPISIFAGIIVGIILAKPTIIHTHYHYYFARRNRMMKSLCVLLLNFASCVVCNSAASADDVVAAGVSKNKVHVVHHWVFPGDYAVSTETALTERSGQPTTGVFLGRLVPEKGIEIVLAAAKLLPDDMEIVIAGDGECSSQVVEARLHNKKITWLGDVPHDAVPSLLASVQFMVWGSIDVNYLSYSAVEALACGKPVVASNRGTNMFGGHENVLGSTLPSSVGILVDPEPEKILDAWIEVASWNLHEVSERAKLFVEEFYGPANFVKLLDLFEECIRGR